MHNNAKTRAIIELIEPSAIGTIIYILVFIGLIIDSQFSKQKLFFQKISVNDFKGTFMYVPVRDFRNTIYSHNVNSLSLYLMWAVIGIVVYIVAYSVVRNFQEVYDDVNLRHYIWPRNTDVDSPLRDDIEKFIFRLGVLIAILIYLIKGIPFLHNWWASKHPASTLNEHMLLNYLYLFIVVFVYLWILTILIRLFLLRKRNI